LSGSGVQGGRSIRDWFGGGLASHLRDINIIIDRKTIGCKAHILSTSPIADVREVVSASFIGNLVGSTCKQPAISLRKQRSVRV
jgi:hypothetical protein